MKSVAFFSISGTCNNSFFCLLGSPVFQPKGKYVKYPRNKIMIRVLLLLTSFLLAACSPPAGGNPENGKKWFMMHNCYACHGRNAKGGKAPEIARTNRRFSSFLRFIRTPQSTVMPNFPEELISRQDAADIYAWLQSLPDK